MLRGDAGGALAQMDSLYQGGADPLMVLQDLLDLSAFPDPAQAGAGGRRRRPAAPKASASAPGRWPQQLSMPVLARAWQMLLKGLEEVQAAPSPVQAAEMVLVRLAYVADLPAPAELVRALSERRRPPPHAAAQPPRPLGATGAATATAPAAPAPTRAVGRAAAGPARRRARRGARARRCRERAPEPRRRPAGARFDPTPQSFAEVVALFDKRREALLRSHLWSHVHLVAFRARPHRVPARATARRAISPTGSAQLLSEWTGTRWVVAVSQARRRADPAPSRRRSATRELRNEVAAPPVGSGGARTFPGATIAAVRERFAAADAARRTTTPPATMPDDEASDRRGRTMKNLGQLMKQAQEMQAKMAEMQAAARSRRDDRRRRRRHGAGDARTARAT